MSDDIAINTLVFLIFVETIVSMRKYLLLTGLIVLLGCIKKRQEPSYLLVEYNGSRVSSMHLQYLDRGFQNFDTATVKDGGMWEFTKDSVPAGFYQLVIDQEPIIRMVLSSGAPTRISIDSTKSIVNIVGASETRAVYQVEDNITKLSNDINEVAATFADSLPARQFTQLRDSLFESINGLKSDCRRNLEEIYNNYHGSLVQLVVLYQQAGNHQLFPPMQDAALYFATDSSLMNRYPDYQPVIEFHHKVNSLRSLKRMVDLTSAGNPMPIFDLPNAWGEQVSYSTFKGKNTLVVVWSSTSEVSRKVTRDLFRRTRAYRRHGVTVVMIALDTETGAWKKAIREDRLPFVHLCDMKGWKSPLVKQLGITGEPLFWVVDSAGIIQRRTNQVEEALSALSLIIKN